MRNVFIDQTEFMGACDQAVGKRTPAQMDLYVDLIDEEVGEFMDAANTIVDDVDACMDLIVVTIGWMASAGLSPQCMQECWDEVVRSNMAKIDPTTGTVLRREDGKIMKPDGWTKPDLQSILLKHGVIGAGVGAVAGTVDTGSDTV